MLEYYVIDTETTGLRAGFNEITEISIIRCSDRSQLTKRIKAEHLERAEPRALQVTGRTLADLMDGEDKFQAVGGCHKFIEQDGKSPEHRCFIGHNVQFDRRFVHALWGEFNKEFPANHWLCTMKFSKNWALKLGSQPENYKLHTMLNFTGINPLPGIHSADSDSRNTYLLWKKGIDNNIDHLSAIKRVPHILK